MRTISLGLSPCPNDTFIFHALLHGLVGVDSAEKLAIDPYFADVQDLNRHAIMGDLPVTKVSAGVLPRIMDKYRILNTGAALGYACGPNIIARDNDFDAENAVIAIPGVDTTANLLLRLHNGYHGKRKAMLFSEIMPAVKHRHVDLGVIIHEGRFTYQNEGLVKILDLGEWWESAFGLPLPLGVIVVRRDVAEEIGQIMQKAIAASILYGRQMPQLSKEFIRIHAQEMEDKIIEAHINTFVNDFSLNLGNAGQSAISHLLKASGYDQPKDLFLKN